jgi:hypothetical protein
MIRPPRAIIVTPAVSSTPYCRFFIGGIDQSQGHQRPGLPPASPRALRFASSAFGPRSFSMASPLATGLTGLIGRTICARIAPDGLP